VISKRVFKKSPPSHLVPMSFSNVFIKWSLVKDIGMELIMMDGSVVPTYHSSDILSIRFKHTRILRIFGLLKKYFKILNTKANFQAFGFL